MPHILTVKSARTKKGCSYSPLHSTGKLPMFEKKSTSYPDLPNSQTSLDFVIVVVHLQQVELVTCADFDDHIARAGHQSK